MSARRAMELRVPLAVAIVAALTYSAPARRRSAATTTRAERAA